MTQTIEATGLSVIVMRESLLSALAGAKPLTNGRQPSMQCVRLRATGRDLLIEATDFSTWATFTLSNLQVVGEGELLVNCDKLSSCLREMAGDTVEIVAADNKLVIRSSQGPATLGTLPSDQMPPALVEKGDESVTVPAAKLRTMLLNTVFSTRKTESTSLAMDGVFVERGSSALSCAATDSTRLSYASTPAPKGKAWSAVVPADVVRVVERLLTGEDVTVSYNGHRIRFESDWFSITAAVIESTFPPYADIIPKDCDKRVTVNREEILSAIRLAMVVAERVDQTPRAAITASKDGIKIVSGFGGEDATPVVSCKYEGAEPITFGMNLKKLSEGISHAAGETVAIDLTTYRRPLLITETTDGVKYQYVQMPINL